MECAIHPGRDAVGACRRCGRPVCDLCGEASNGTFVCSRCLPPSFFDQPSQQQQQSSESSNSVSVASWQRQRKSPALAACLAIMPSLGHLYLGLYTRAFALFVVFVVLVQLVEVHELAGLFLAFFWFFQLFDAHRLATAMNLAVVTGSRGQGVIAAEPPPAAGVTPEPEPPPPPREEPETAEAEEAAAEQPAGERQRSSGSRALGVVLLTLGVLLTLTNLGVPWMRLLVKLWPLLLIVFGARLLARYWNQR